MASFLAEVLAPYRNVKITNAEILEILSKGAHAVRERVHSTISRVKAAIGVDDLNRLHKMVGQS
jgi:hypothetical protein